MIFNAERHDNSDIIKTFAAGFARLSFNLVRYNCSSNTIKDLINERDVSESSLEYTMAWRDGLIQYDFGNKPGDMMFLLRTDTICVSHRIKLDLDYIRWEHATSKEKRY